MVPEFEVTTESMSRDLFKEVLNVAKEYHEKIKEERSMNEQWLAAIESIIQKSSKVDTPFPTIPVPLSSVTVRIAKDGKFIIEGGFNVGWIVCDDTESLTEELTKLFGSAV